MNESADATEASNHRPLVVALQEEQPTSHASFQNRVLDMLTREMSETRKESRASSARVESAVTRMADRFERSQRSVYLLAALLVVGMIAAVGGNLWIQYTRAGMTAGTGDHSTLTTPEAL